MLKFLSYFLVQLVLISCRTIFPAIERNENDFCITRNGVQGKCTLITSCPTLRISLHLRRNHPTICSWDRLFPIICCPLVSSRGDRESTELTTSKPLNNQLKEKAKCGIKPPKKFQVHIYVVGGDEVKSSTDWPWMAALFTKQNNQYDHFCGGTIISDSCILTAAHCVNHLLNQVNKLYVGVGSNELDKTTKIPIRRVVVHPNYRDSKSYFDIALLMTSTKINFTDSIIPICLPGPKVSSFTEDSTQDDSNLTLVEVAGWGRQAYGGRAVSKLRSARLEILSHQKCNQSYSSLNTPSIPQGIKTDQLCAGTTNAEKDSCQGDSGGPLTFKANEEIGVDVHYQIGIISFGRRCAVKDFPGIYTKVSDYVPWIETQLNQRTGRVNFG
ncbi:clotting factor B [Tetranychus urticae]|uniref:Peptidase S1 domain-containing protein n=1 Tax=Tetranychus urticae TaxID=32264 RepID=T1KKD9_TETUR|nr:clotting factor B [Tetranychus urticae]